jgi:hypothetical protein
MNSAALATIPVKDWTNQIVDELTKKYANAPSEPGSSGGGHYRANWLPGRPWCCWRCRAINDALKELLQHLKERS